MITFDKQKKEDFFTSVFSDFGRTSIQHDLELDPERQIVTIHPLPFKVCTATIFEPADLRRVGRELVKEYVKRLQSAVGKINANLEPKEEPKPHYTKAGLYSPSHGGRLTHK